MALVFKGHYTGGYADTTLPFDLHKIAGGVFLYLVALYGSGCLNSPAKKQELLGKGGFTGIRVRDDGKGLAFIYFVYILHAITSPQPSP